MDEKLVAWARAVKARRPHGPPPLWLFTDPVAHPDLPAVVAALPRDRRRGGLCGVVFRHDDEPGRAALCRAVARACRDRGIAMAIAGAASRSGGAGGGRHAREGRGGGRALTASAHSVAAAVRARRLCVAVVFISPVFPTASHPGGVALGPFRWARLARYAGGRAAALGGMSGGNVRRLPAATTQAVGAIRALGRPDVAERQQCSTIAMEGRV